MRVILHIGQHKTGSKALQSALYANRDSLAAHGFAYPVPDGATGKLRPYEMNHRRLFEVVRAATREGCGPNAKATVMESLRELLAICPPATDSVILSAEDFFDMRTAHDADFSLADVAAASTLLAQALADLGASVTVVSYLRRQDHLLAAHYAQFIKGSNRHHPTLESFREQFSPRLDADAILAAWESAFGIEAVAALPYELSHMPGGIVADFFTRILRLEPPSVTVPYPDDLEAFNITPSRDWLEYMRMLNRRSSRGEQTLPRQAVLEAAFQDRANKSVGIAAWLSPADRAELLAAYDDGNRRIAMRHGLGKALFCEPLPCDGDPWTPPRPLSLERLIDRDVRARSRATTTHKLKHALWLLSPHAEPEDEAAAVAFFTSVAGDPTLDHRIETRIRLDTLRARPALVVRVGSQDDWWSTACLNVLRWAGLTVVVIESGKPRSGSARRALT